MSRLLDSFASGQIVRPTADTLNTVDLVRALATLAGAPGFTGPGASAIGKMLGAAEHYIFVLIDGLGMNILRRLPPGSFLAQHLRAELHAICPSTTACAMTTLSTGQWPAAHAVTGWWTYLAERNQTCTLLPFVDRFTGKPLQCAPQDILPCKSFFPTMKYSPLTLQHAHICDTTYSRHWRADTPSYGYTHFPDAIDKAIEHATSREPTYTYLYFHDLDSLSHKVGWDHESILKMAMMLDEQLARLSDALGREAVIAVSSDHGQIDVPVESRFALYDNDNLMRLQRIPPSGNPRLPLFHLHPGKQEEFAEKFRRRFADHFALLSIDEADDLRLFGPEPMTPLARARFGDFVAIPYGSQTLNHYPSGKSPATDYYGQHAGLSPDEMLVPLIIS
jgi:hypothetical protein